MEETSTEFLEGIREMIEQWRLERSRTQMTLGELIGRLEQLNSSVTLCIYYPHSYRGYYSDLAFEQGEPRPVNVVLQEVERCLGKTFSGWKGGEYVMTEDTPLWIAECGQGGDPLMNITDDGSLVTKVEEND